MPERGISRSWRGGALTLLACGALGFGGAARADSESAGDVLRLAIPAAAYGLTFLHHDPDARPQFYKSLGMTVGSTWVLKETVHKERPDGTGDDAFPSGHASAAFQGASFIHRRYGIKEAWPAYVLAAYTGWTRVDADKHDTTDVLAGAALGVASSFIFVKRREVAVSAFYDGSGFGIRIAGNLR
ncbi:MAG TPA: phosphatase PAP2 family protein [Gammaproteobacteria bacterium]|nr:phosphatase PAP2 family protein [Gammaproteobacteria bacterium]